MDWVQSKVSQESRACNLTTGGEHTMHISLYIRQESDSFVNSLGMWLGRYLLSDKNYSLSIHFILHFVDKYYSFETFATVFSTQEQT